MKSTLLNIVVVIAILGSSFVITHLFARAMYIRCVSCGTLNAKRRSNCRSCQQELK